MNNFGQFKSNSQDVTFVTNINNINISQIEVESLYSVNENNFINKCIQMTFNENLSYYLSFSVEPLSTDQTFSLKLINDPNVLDRQEQIIQTYFVPAYSNEVPSSQQPVNFEIIISPNTNYSMLIWELQRIGIDYTDENGGRKMNITMNKFQIITNLLNNNISSTQLKKIGIQGPPSMLMCINRQQIRIGKSGIYEINNGMNINFIGFIPKQNDFFIMDYQY